MRLRFVVAALRNPAASKQFAEVSAASPLGELLAEWPQTVGALVWPYQCAAWNAMTRVHRIAEHCRAVREIPGLHLQPDEKLVLADLSSFAPAASLILDRPPWLAREGHLTLSLFKADFRAFTLSFSISGVPQTELFIGGLQGRHGDDILAMYRDLTKDLNGIRPRDFMLESLRMFALKIGVGHIYAIADEFKISRHRYFGKKSRPAFSTMTYGKSETPNKCLKHTSSSPSPDRGARWKKSLRRSARCIDVDTKCSMRSKPCCLTT
jgi:uncharacterized protein VirK/YbjX